MEQVEKFDPSTLMQGVKDRIKATFISLIPDDQWDVMVKKEIDSFFNELQKISISSNKDTSQNYWNPSVHQSMVIEQTPFRSMVWNFCAEACNKKLKESIIADYFDGLYNDSAEVKGGLKNLIAEIAPGAAIQFFQQITEMQMHRLRNEIQNFR